VSVVVPFPVIRSVAPEGWERPAEQATVGTAPDLTLDGLGEKVTIFSAGFSAGS
jgi:hypothetical protein